MADQARNLVRIVGSGDPVGDLCLTLLNAIREEVLLISPDASNKARNLLERMAAECSALDGDGGADNAAAS